MNTIPPRNPPITPEPEDDDNLDNPDDLPIIYPDDDPDNANWLRILAKRREEEAAKRKQSPQKS